MNSRESDFARVIVIVAAAIVIALLVVPLLGMMIMMSMMGGVPFAGMPMMGMGGVALVWLVVLVAIGAFLIWLLRRAPAERSNDAMDILQRRYAAGEVSRDDYERMRDELRRDRAV